MSDITSPTTRTLLTVIEVTSASGAVHYECTWNADLYDALDVVGPDGGVTDRIMDIMDELRGAFDEDED